MACHNDFINASRLTSQILKVQLDFEAQRNKNNSTILTSSLTDKKNSELLGVIYLYHLSNNNQKNILGAEPAHF